MTLERPQGVGLGFNIIGGEEEVGIFVSVISKEGVAAENGQLKVGDMILEVNKTITKRNETNNYCIGEWTELGKLVT